MIKLAAVVQLIDSFSKQPAAASALAFLINDEPVIAHAKQQAFYAFSDLDEGTYRLKIVCRKKRFLDQEVSLSVPPGEPLADAIVLVAMRPGPTYSYPPGTTLITGQAKGAGQQPLSGVEVEANYISVRGNAKTASTFSFESGRHAGCFTLVLSANLAPHSDVKLNFKKSGLKSVQKTVTVQSGVMQYVSVEMQ